MWIENTLWDYSTFEKEMNGEPDTVVIPFDAKEDILVGTINLIRDHS